MIKRQKLKQAVDAIAAREPAIGYALNEMLAMGVIDALPPHAFEENRDQFSFLFDRQKIHVNKYLYFQDDTVPIEQRLLVKYGELAGKQELREKSAALGYAETARRIRAAGLRLLVDYEVGYALERLGEKDADPAASGPADPGPIASRLAALRSEPGALPGEPDSAEPPALFHGTVGGQRPALFLRFPFSRDGLMQVAELDLEFFHVRFLLNVLMRGLDHNLFACLVDRRIAGLVYITFQERFFSRILEIKYMATVTGKAADAALPQAAPIRGIGTFLVAGVWLHWKADALRATELVLDAEIGARRFYDSLGFQRRGLSDFVLKQPRGYLLRQILIMANQTETLREQAAENIASLIVSQLKALKQRAGGEKRKAERKVTLEVIRESLKPVSRPLFRRAALTALARWKKRIPEHDELLQCARQPGGQGAGNP